MSAYDELEARFERIGTLREALAVLSWDHSAMMPPGGAGARQAQIATLEAICHERVTDPAIGDLLAGAASDGGLDPWQSANLGEMRRDHVNARALPTALVEARIAASLECEMIWRDARPADDFAAVRPALQRLLQLTREMAAAKASVFGMSSYDALLDAYEPGGRAAEVDRLFADLAGFLPELTAEILERQASRPAPVAPPGPFPVERQRAVAARLMTAVGFDFDHGRLDVSLHPFCGGTPDDVRVTTRYDTDDFGRALMGVLHETGHALYEQGLPRRWRRQPVGRARSFSIHESQSLLVEMQACRSREFAEFCAPILHEAFGGPAAAWDPDNLYRLNTRVARSLIRVDADEVTYPAHVILRYRLERASTPASPASASSRTGARPAAWSSSTTQDTGRKSASTGSTGGCESSMRGERGFTLIEVLVAFAIAAMAFVVLFRTAGSGLASARTAGRYEEAVSRARSHLAALGNNIHATEEELTGDDGGGYRWRLAVTPTGTTRPPPEDSSDEGGRPSPPMPLILYAVKVTIAWDADGRERSVTLRSDRLGYAEASGP